MTGSESERTVRLDRTDELRGRRKRDSMLTRGLAILSAFRTDDVELTLAELARRVDLPKPTAHRLIAELLDSGFLERGQRGLVLGRQMFVLGGRLQRDQKIRVLAQPHLQHLRRVTGTSLVCLSVARGRDVVHLLRVGTSRVSDEREKIVDLGARRVLAQVPQGTGAGFGPGIAPGSGHGPGAGAGAGAGAGQGVGSSAGPGHGLGHRAGSGPGHGSGSGAGSGPSRGPASGPGRGRGRGPGAGADHGSTAGPGSGPENPALRALAPTGGPVVRLDDAVHACTVLACPVRLPGTGVVLALSAVSVAGKENRAALARELHRVAQELGARLAALPDFHAAPTGVSGAA
ncbi:helix-turn-helix domain-containing protein [Streptomyces roseirectus]|uniref:Helix-turn-helix domain-containing protein n=1 Tax=Streptomyces roseirectus TaxID=2768066 RepID=A0A7H0IE62_9ACTN|nr:helix-turn-helix domain-containing protein [Streptomyces roseirectus]QNP71078.1 helix-turn-helix domain-containing protein [Streptomyces roseirectus]